jgi:iron(III) transport system ATP-binding protein
MTAQLQLNSVAVAYGQKPVVQGISFALQPGEIGCLLGPSGCGKTSLLRAIAGFEAITHGDIILAGSTVSHPGLTVPSEKRHVGMVFQDFALFPHLSVRDNIGFGLRKFTASARERRIAELLSLVSLTDWGHAMPHELSGGMQQRVALARAMAPRPDVLMLDEPFSSMDAELREQLALEIRIMLKRDNMTAILVTHDQFEAFAMADTIGVLGKGHLHQWGTPTQLYHRPQTRFVASFIGQSTFLDGAVLDGGNVRTILGDASISMSVACQAAHYVEIVVRPENVIYDPLSPLQLKLKNKSFRGSSHLYTLQAPDDRSILCSVPSQVDHDIGSPIGVRLELADALCFPK